MANSSGLLIVIGEPLCGPNICSASIVRAVRAAVKRPLWRRLEPRPEGLVLARLLTDRHVLPPFNYGHSSARRRTQLVQRSMTAIFPSSWRSPAAGLK